MKTSEILDIIFKNANVEFKHSGEEFNHIRKQFRYYRKDIPGVPRYKFDADAVYFYNCDASIKAVADEAIRRAYAERGDIMTSIWAPVTYYLKLNSNRIISKCDVNIDRILDSLEKNIRTKEIFGLIGYLTENYVSRGNLLLLPDSVNENNKKNLNPDKFRLSEDKIDQFLYVCLDGVLIKYFNAELDNVVKWILSEHLECMFSDQFFENSIIDILNGGVKVEINEKDINVEKLQSLIGDSSRISTYKYRDLTDDEWETYFERLLPFRNCVPTE